MISLGIILIIAILILLLKDYATDDYPVLHSAARRGVVGAMLLTGKSFTFCAIVGALGLVGMLIKNCIVLMDEINGTDRLRNKNRRKAHFQF